MSFIKPAANFVSLSFHSESEVQLLSGLMKFRNFVNLIDACEQRKDTFKKSFSLAIKALNRIFNINIKSVYMHKATKSEKNRKDQHEAIV
jgi:hypothetical protein